MAKARRSPEGKRKRLMKKKQKAKDKRSNTVRFLEHQVDNLVDEKDRLEGENRRLKHENKTWKTIEKKLLKENDLCQGRNQRLENSLLQEYDRVEKLQKERYGEETIQVAYRLIVEEK